MIQTSFLSSPKDKARMSLMGLKVMAVTGRSGGTRLKMFLLELQSQKEMTPLSQLVPRKEGYTVMRMVRTPDAKATYLDSAVLDTGDLLSSTPGGHHGARHLLVAGQGHQVQAPICAPCRSGSQQSW